MKRTSRAVLAGVVILGTASAAPADEAVALGTATRTLVDGEDPAATGAAQQMSVVPERVRKIGSERALRSWIRTWPNMRLGHPFETWSWDSDAMPGLRTKATCFNVLRRSGVRFRQFDEEPPALVPFPVKVERVPGVVVRGRDLVVSCEMATRLPALAEALRAHGITGMTVMSAWRDHPLTSFHTLGLALDVSRFSTTDGEVLDVEHDYVKTDVADTCATPAPAGKARRLQEIACDLYSRRLFSTVLTPNYNVGHHDHFHVDLRPGDERFYLR